MTDAERYLGALLEQKIYINEMIRHKQNLIEKSKTIKTVDTSIERVQTSHNVDRICNITTEIAALEQEIAEENSKLLEFMQECQQLLSNVHEVAYIRVLNQIYMMFRTPEQAAVALKRSRSWVYVKHEEAIKVFEQENREFLNKWVIKQMENSELVESLMDQLYEIQQKKRQVEDEELQIKTTLLGEMQKSQIKKLENVKIRISYMDRSYRRTVNGKLLKELYPEAFNKCIKKSEVQPHLRVQVSA